MPEKNWVFDTVALSNFLLSDSIFILTERYHQYGIITWQVYDEISSGITEYPELTQIHKLLEDRTFELVSLSKKEHQHFLQLIGHLGKGEASCTAYAKKQDAIVVTDDRTARKQCSMMKIPVTGTVGILKASVSEGNLSLDQADESLHKMIEAGFYSPIRSLADIV
jgi:predicted nucleic acid-binding protein